MAILKKKADAEHIVLPDDVALYLATNIKSNVRELEGSLIRLAAFASLKRRRITVEFAKETLKHFLSQPSANLTVETIQKEVAAYFNVKVSDLKSAKRHKTVARPRQIAMFLCRKLTSSSFPDIGQRFGGKDHSTVISACQEVEKTRRARPLLRGPRRDAGAPATAVELEPELPDSTQRQRQLHPTLKSAFTGARSGPADGDQRCRSTNLGGLLVGEEVLPDLAKSRLDMIGPEWMA